MLRKYSVPPYCYSVLGPKNGIGYFSAELGLAFPLFMGRFSHNQPAYHINVGEPQPRPIGNQITPISLSLAG